MYLFIICTIITVKSEDSFIVMPNEPGIFYWDNSRLPSNCTLNVTNKDGKQINFEPNKKYYTCDHQGSYYWNYNCSKIFKWNESFGGNYGDHAWIYKGDNKYYYLDGLIKITVIPYHDIDNKCLYAKFSNTHNSKIRYLGKGIGYPSNGGGSTRCDQILSPNISSQTFDLIFNGNKYELDLVLGCHINPYFISQSGLENDMRYYFIADDNSELSCYMDYGTDYYNFIFYHIITITLSVFISIFSLLFIFLIFFRKNTYTPIK